MVLGSAPTRSSESRCTLQTALGSPGYQSLRLPWLLQRLCRKVTSRPRSPLAGRRLSTLRLLLPAPALMAAASQRSSGTGRALAPLRRWQTPRASCETTCCFCSATFTSSRCVGPRCAFVSSCAHVRLACPWRDAGHVQHAGDGRPLAARSALLSDGHGAAGALQSCAGGTPACCPRAFPHHPSCLLPPPLVVRRSCSRSPASGSTCGLTTQAPFEQCSRYARACPGPFCTNCWTRPAAPRFVTTA